MRRNDVLIAQVYEAVADGLTHVDEIAARCGVDVNPGDPLDYGRQSIVHALQVLVFDGRVVWPRSPGGNFIDGGIRLAQSVSA